MLGVAVMGAIFAARIGDLAPGDPRFPAAFMEGFENALLTGGIVALAGGVIAAFATAPASQAH